IAEPVKQHAAQFDPGAHGNEIIQAANAQFRVVGRHAVQPLPPADYAHVRSGSGGELSRDEVERIERNGLPVEQQLADVRIALTNHLNGTCGDSVSFYLAAAGNYADSVQG